MKELGDKKGGTTNYPALVKSIFGTMVHATDNYADVAGSTPPPHMRQGVITDNGSEEL